MTRAELNNAIYTVLTTQFKKYAKDAHRAVKEAGYTIDKWCGYYHVKNEATGRCLSVETSDGWYRRTYYVRGCRKMATFENYEKLMKFDFVGCLEKSLNADYYQTNKAYHPTLDKYNRLKDAKFYVKYRNNDIEKLKKEIEKLQGQINEYTQWVRRDEKRLSDIRKEYGLKEPEYIPFMVVEQ